VEHTHKTRFRPVTILPLKHRGMFDFWVCVSAGFATETKAIKITAAFLIVN